MLFQSLQQYGTVLFSHGRRTYIHSHRRRALPGLLYVQRPPCFVAPDQKITRPELELTAGSALLSYVVPPTPVPSMLS